MQHLVRSNEQLRPLADEGDDDCAEAVRENDEVMLRMRERLRLLRAEVERRGYGWEEYHRLLLGTEMSRGGRDEEGRERVNGVWQEEIDEHEEEDDGSAEAVRGGRAGGAHGGAVQSSSDDMASLHEDPDIRRQLLELRHQEQGQGQGQGRGRGQGRDGQDRDGAGLHL